MSRALAAFVIGLAVVAAPAAAAPRERGKANDIICKREKKLASRFETKVCLTRAQWALLSEEHKRAYTETRDRPIIEIRK